MRTAAPTRPEPLHGTSHLLDVRVLCLGNDLLADDALGFRVASALRGELGDREPSSVDIVETPEFGFALLDHLQDVRRVVVIDTVVTGRAESGTLYRIAEDEDWGTAPGASPHYVGLFEALSAGRALGLPVAEEVVILAVEASDVVTVGGSMSSAVEAAVPLVVSEVRTLLDLQG
jgi:hydrogenase maturation protease